MICKDMLSRSALHNNEIFQRARISYTQSHLIYVQRWALSIIIAMNNMHIRA